MVLDSQQAKLFIKVDGVIGDRKRICTFCINTIHGAEKIVETTRKLRHGPYFPQLAHLQSSVGKIDTLGRATVCLPCFHQLLRQWSSYEMKNIPISRRIYKHVSDKGVKNYQETRAKEIRVEAEKRAFAIHTNQEHFVKKAFDRLTKCLDAQDEIIRQSEECIEKLNIKLILCTKGEEWKINREIKKHKKIIDTAEAQIEEEEDKEELIRKHTKSLLEAYRKNQLLFKAVPKQILCHSSLQNKKEKPISCEENVHHISENQVETLQSEIDGRSNMSRNREFRECRYTYYDDKGGETVAKTVMDSENDRLTDIHLSPSYTHNDGRDFWVSIQGASIGETQSEPNPDDFHWRLSKEIVYVSQSNEVHSFPEDEWSKLFDKQQNSNENQCQSGKTECTSVTWIPQRNDYSDGTEWSQIQGEIAESEPKLNEAEHADDSAYKYAQSYQANANHSNGSYFQTYDISESVHEVRSYSSKDRTTKSNGNDEGSTTLEHDVLSEADIDPWSIIEIEKGTKKTRRVESKRSETQGRDSSDYVGDDHYEDDYIDEDSYNNKGILSPSRLNPDRFSQFTRSSYIPELVREKNPRMKFEGRTMNSSNQLISNEKSEMQHEYTTVESSKCLPDQRAKNTQQANVSYDPLEPLRKSRNAHDQRLSVEEEQWETKHLSPKRLDETRWLSIVNGLNTDAKSTAHHNIYIQEQTTRSFRTYGSKNSANGVRPDDNIGKGKNSSTFSNTHYNNSNNSEETNRSKDCPSDDKSHVSDKLNETHVERSPALRKLMKRDEISEGPVRRVATRASVESSPWDDVNNSERVYLKRNQSPNQANDAYIMESKGIVSQERIVRPGCLKYSEQYMDENDQLIVRPAPSTPTGVRHTVIIEDQLDTNHDDNSRNKKLVGKVNLSLWEKNVSSQADSSISAVGERFPYENRSASTTSRDRFQSDESRQSTMKSDYNTQERAYSNGSYELCEHINHSSFNKSMTEDELAWEKRFSKTYERKISAEEPGEVIVRRKVSDQRIPRLSEGSLDDNQNYFNFGKISLDETEVLRVRGKNTNTGNKTDYGNEEIYPASNSLNDRSDENDQRPSSPKQPRSIKYGDSAQLTEEELAWEKKTSRPGRLDFSKFSQFK